VRTVKRLFRERGFRHCTEARPQRDAREYRATKNPRVILVDAPALFALAALISSLSGLVWSIRRKP
jgi:hypothetical protein